jgi:hypothetical protein
VRRQSAGESDLYRQVVSSEPKQVNLRFLCQLGGFLQIHGAPRHLHRQDVFF